MFPRSRATRPGIGLVIVTLLSLLLSAMSIARPPLAEAATATVDGRVTASDGYTRFADLFATPDGGSTPVAIATVWWTQDATSLYFALELNALGENVANENVYAADRGYHDTFDTEWNNHNFGHLLNSDAASFAIACGGVTKDRFVHDYLYEVAGTYASGTAGPDGSLVTGGPLATSSSMVWNSGLGYADFTTKSPDFNPQYPTPHATETPVNWVWEMTYEFSLDASKYENCGPITFAMPPFAGETGGVGGMHNSPAKGFADSIIIPPTDPEDPELSIIKSPDAGVVNAGDPISFGITVQNTATEANATNVVINDNLPSGFAWTDDQEVCTIAGLALLCNVGTLAPGQQFTVNVSAPTSGTTPCGLITNSARTSGGGIAEISDGGAVTISCAAVEVTKTPDGGSIEAGAVAAFTITTKNAGLGQARDVTLTDTLPATANGWTIATNWSADESNDCDLVGLLLSCGPIDLAGGASIDVAVESTTTNADCGLLHNLKAEAKSTNDGSDIDDGKLTVTCPDVRVSKSASAATVLAPGSLSYTITATNDGGAAATNVVVSDMSLDTGLGITSASFDVNPGVAGGEGSCSIDADTNDVSCAVGTLAASDGAADGPDTVKVTIRADVPATACGTINNTATVSAGNESPSHAGDNSSNEVTVTVTCPDASVTKTATATAIDAGGTASFTIGVAAGDLGTSSDVILTDALPAGLSWTLGGDVSACTVDGSPITNPVAGGKTLLCNFGPLAPDGTKQITLSAPTTTANCAAEIRNDATITVAGDTNPANNTAWDVITVFCPDVSLTKEGGNAINAGEWATFTIKVKAGGTGTSENVTVTDLLIGAKADWTFDVMGADDSACTIDDEPRLFCDFGTLPATTEITIVLSYETDAADCDSIENSAAVSASNDTNASNDSSDPATVAVDCPDLRLEKTGSQPVSAGHEVAFTLTVSNLGDGDASEVVLTDELPGIGVGPWEISEKLNVTDCVLDGDNLTCARASLAGGESFSVTLEARTDPNACPSIENDALVVAGNEPVADQHPNADSYTIMVACPDLTVVKAAVASPISAGQQGQFTLEVTNIGEGSALEVEVVDTAPPGTEWTVLDSGGFSCSDEMILDQQTITCTLAELAPGEANARTILVGYTTSPDDCGELDNSVNLSADNESSEKMANNSSGDSIIVECAGLNLVKSADADTIDAGDLAAFTIRIWNAGEGSALAAEFADELPVGFDWHWELVNPDLDDVCASSLDDEGRHAISCEFGTLAPSPMPMAPYTTESPGKVIRVWAQTDRGDCGPLENTATASASNHDEVDSTDTVTVTCPTIELEKGNDAVGPVLPGTEVTYTLTLTVEDGPAEDVVVVDVLPDGLDDPTGISSSGAFSATSRTITWELGDLTDGEYILMYQATVASDARHGDELVNAARATSRNSQCPDAEMIAPECEDDSTVIVRVPTLVIDKVASSEVIAISGPSGALVAAPSVVTWTLSYALTNGPVTNAVITDEIPTGFVFLDATAGGSHAGGTVTWELGTLTASGSVTFRTTVDPEAISRTAPTVNVAVIDSDQTGEDEGEDSVTVTVEPPVLGGNPTPKPRLPDTAVGLGMEGEPLTVPIELLVALFIGSLGALPLATVTARNRRR